MSDIGGGRSLFDATFFAIEGAAGLFVLVLVMVLVARRGILGHWLPRWPAALLLAASVVFGPGIAIYWQVAYPNATGLLGLDRLVFGGSSTIAIATVAGLCAFAMLEGRVRWLALAPAGLVIGFWVLFLV